MSRDAKVNELKLKERVKELESEVASLKKRLDDLRKAKNTTVFKREREVLEVGAPFGRRASQGQGNNGRASDLEKKMEAAEQSQKEAMEAMRKKFEQQMEDTKNSFKDCGHEELIQFLQQRCDVMEHENLALQSENQDLRSRVDSLVMDLSVKEAKWCETEEQMTLKLKTSFGEKYKEWMEATESKIDELQRTNELLRGYLKNSHPDRRDPAQ